MKPYYKDKLVTIYNTPTFILKSDVVVLDPPGLLNGANRFDAKIIYIFVGSHAVFYEAQFQGRVTTRVPWRFTVPNEDGIVKTVFNDIVLMVGTNMGPGVATYKMKPDKERYSHWERPLALAMNLLAESEGDVLDPYMGTGAFLVASKRLGRKSTGFDTDESCCEIAAKRLMEV